MKVVLDACVMYPTVLRQILIGVAEAGLFEPVWSPRILEEWARAAAKNGGAVDEDIARGDIARLQADWPAASVAPQNKDLTRLVLPDVGDVHVLGTAIASSADGILTFNAQDFPRGVLSDEGVARFEPDGFLRALWGENPEAVAQVAEHVRRRAEAASGRAQPMRALLKRARLPRLGKTLG